MSLSEIAAKINGKVIGNPNFVISGVSEIQNASPNTITFLGNPAYKKYLSNTNADAILVTNANILNGRNGIVVPDPQLAMAKTIELFYPNKIKKPLIHKSAIIGKNVKIGKKVHIEPGCVIKKGAIIGDECSIGSNSVIGENTVLGLKCEIFSNVSIYDNIKIGNNVIVHSGTSIGSEGFGYVQFENTHKKIPQVGNVIIKDDVEIGSNCAIDRATIGSTIIGRMTKIDNLVHIAHNVKIGKGCLLTACFAIAGSSEIGDYCTFAGQVGVAPHIKIGDHSIIAAKSGVTKSLKGNQVYSGMPAREIKDHNKRLALINDIEKLRAKLDQLIKSKIDH